MSSSCLRTAEKDASINRRAKSCVAFSSSASDDDPEKFGFAGCGVLEEGCSLDERERCRSFASMIISFSYVFAKIAN